MPSKRPSIMIRTSKEIIDKFAEISEKENRSMSNMGEYLIKKYIEEYESKEKRSQQKSDLEESLISGAG